LITPRGMRLTPKGISLKKRAEKVLAEFHQFKGHAFSLQTHLVGEIKLGLNRDAKFLRISDLFTRQQSQYPDLQIHLQQNMSWEVVEKIQLGELDGGFIYGNPSNDRVEALNLCQYKVVIVGPAPGRKSLMAQLLNNWQNYPGFGLPLVASSTKYQLNCSRNMTDLPLK